MFIAASVKKGIRFLRRGGMLYLRFDRLKDSNIVFMVWLMPPQTLDFAKHSPQHQHVQAAQQL